MSKSTVSIEYEVPISADSFKSQANRDWLAGAFIDALAPEPMTGMTAYCDNHLILPSNSAEPGQYRSTRTPYIRAIMDAMNPTNHIRKVVVYTGTQVGKTQVILNTFFYYTVNSPSPMLFGFSNNGESKKMVNTRIDPMIEANEALKERIFSPKKRATGNTNSLKLFPGGFLSIASGEAPASFRSLPCRIVLLDELDAMPDDIGGEGSPVELAKKRTSTFSGREKVFIASTTTNKSSKIVAEYEATDMRKYFVPCPHCGGMQLIEWKRFKWINEKTQVKDVWMECEHCKEKIYNHHKTEMLEKGEWKPTNNNPTDKTSIGFWLSGLYAPVGWQSWESCVTDYLVALSKQDIPKLTAFYNGILAEPYEQSATLPDKDLIQALSRKSGYQKGTIPEDVLILTSAADIQADRIEVEIKGWCRNGRSRSIDYRVFMCQQHEKTESLDASVWEQYYHEILMGSFIRVDGVALWTAANAMDRSYNTATVNAFWLKCNNDRFHLVRGVDSMKSYISHIKSDKAGTATKKQQFRSIYRYYDIGVSLLKQNAYSNLRTKNEHSTTPNVCFFPEDYDDEYFNMLISEEFIPPTKSHKHGLWKKIRDRNEALDCHIYNMAMWHLLELYKWNARDYDELEEQLKLQKQSQTERLAARQKARKVLSRGINF